MLVWAARCFIDLLRRDFVDIQVGLLFVAANTSLHFAASDVSERGNGGKQGEPLTFQSVEGVQLRGKKREPARLSQGQGRATRLGCQAQFS